jgi:hypothetical protein
MNKSWILLSLIYILISCNNDKNSVNHGKSLKDEAIDIAVKYASAKFTAAKQTVEKNGIIIIQDAQVNFVAKSDNGIKYIIDPSEIIIGLIDGDNEQDALFTISSLKGQYLRIPEILIMTRTGGHLILNREIESDMKVLSVKNRLITAEISTKSRNSPLRDCLACKEIVKYRFINGDLVKEE